MIKLGGLIDLRPQWLGEAEDDKYVSIGFGKFKEKGKEDDENAPTFKKDDSGKYVPTSDKAAKGGDSSAEKKPKVNIFDKPKSSDDKIKTIKKMSPKADTDALKKLAKTGEPEDEPKDGGRPKDSTGGRAGNPEVNKSVRRKAKSLGITAKQLGREEYERRMKKAAVEALTDSNFHSEARKLIAVLEDKPEWAKDPNQDPNKPDIMSPEYEKWQKTSVYSSDFYDSAPGTDEIAHEASQQAGWDGVSALDAIAFDLKVNGSKDLALKIQGIIDDTNESTMRLKDLVPEGIINEGTKSHVGIIEPNGRIGSTYVHYDGYPQNMKGAIKHHFKNAKDVKDFIKKGGAQGLYKGKDPEYYGKNGFFASGKFNDLEKYYRSVDQRGGGAAYIYLFNMKDKKWYVYDYYGGSGELKRLY